MVSHEQIRDQLPRIKRFGPGLVGVFVGGTSGIGESTAREFIRYAISPRIYLVGRSHQDAARIQAEFRQLNATSDVRYILADVSELRNVDEVCEQIKSQEHRINLLCLSAGIFHFRGREETSEHLDRKLSLDFYSRLRFTENLLPQLRQAAAISSASSDSQGPPLASVISVLGGGEESSIDDSDLSLKNNYTTGASVKHAVTMTTLTFDRLASDPQNAGVSFFHTSPGMVRTNGHRELGVLFKSALSVFIWAFSSLTVPVQECGERHLWTAASGAFRGDGVHLVGKGSEKSENTKVLTQLRKNGMPGKVWEHTRAVFRETCDGERTRFSA